MYAVQFHNQPNNNALLKHLMHMKSDDNISSHHSIFGSMEFETNLHLHSYLSFENKI